jgi:hypothetical protein
VPQLRLFSGGRLRHKSVGVPSEEEIMGAISLLE